MGLGRTPTMQPCLQLDDYKSEFALLCPKGWHLGLGGAEDAREE